MFVSKIFPKTRFEDPGEAISPGTKLLIRCGFIDQLTGGIWFMTALGLAVRRRAEQIVREEMNRAGAIEMEVPILHPKELWDETGRWDKYLKAGISFTSQDRRGAGYILAPTAEEPITLFAKRHLRSYRDLPIILYQISPKFRDEFRPRQGLIRGREFIMKDAYSFDLDERSMRESYHLMEEAYKRICQRCGFNYIEVEADSGAIGGSGSAEFMALTEYGEDTLLYCPKCHYGGNQEKAVSYYPPYAEEQSQGLTMISTINIKTVNELEEFVKLPASKMVKTIVLSADGKPVVVSMRGDLEISEVKLANLLKAESVAIAEAYMVEEVTGAPVGFAGPIDLFGRTKVPYYFDKSVQGLKNFLCGGNEVDVHFINVNTGRDFPQPDAYYDLSKAVAGMHCSECKSGIFETKRGIELGHIFMLQQLYSQPMSASCTDLAGNKIPFWMGCYGVGVSRIVQAIVEQSYDEKGIIWPLSLTPFHAVIIPVNSNQHLDIAKEVYSQLKETGLDVLLDDTEARIGEKFTVAELLGIPVQVVIGKTWLEKGKLEVRWRDSRNFDSELFKQESAKVLPSCLMDLSQFKLWLTKIYNFSEKSNSIKTQ